MTQHVELLVEEPSMEAFLRGVLPRMLPLDHSFDVYPFLGKQDLLQKLPARLNGYKKWLPPEWRIVIVVDRDNDDCRQLKGQLDKIARRAGLRTKSSASTSWQLANRIAVEELEAWYFGDWQAVCAAYPGPKATIPKQKGFRNPDAIAGGTSEALERILKRHGHFTTGLRKIELAREIAKHFDPSRCQSPSFRCFYSAVR